MISLGPLSLAAPAVLAGLAALPLLWWLIRRLPPPTQRVVFPAVRLLGPVVEEPPPQARPPWWLLALRLGALTALLLGLAGPRWDPTPNAPSPDRLLLVLDNGWQAAPGWQEMISAARNRIEALEGEAARVALVTTAAPAGGWPNGVPPAPNWVTPRTALALLAQLAPQPWPADREATARQLARFAPGSADETLWITTGWDTEGAGRLGAVLEALGPARLVIVPARMLAIRQFDGTAGGWRVQLVRPEGLPAETARLTAVDTSGRPRAETLVTFPAGETSATVRLNVAVGDLARISRLTVSESRSAATTALIDAATLHPRVAVLSGERRGEPRPLQSAAFYVRRALEPYADVDAVPLEDMLSHEANLRVFLDLPVTGQDQAAAMMRWVREGGIAITFAGPRIAQNGTELAPGPLLTGTRAVGTRLSWDKPQKLGGFATDGPLAGLSIDPEVTITRQVLVADPSAPGLMRWAWLEDGTPLVTARAVGAGALVMVHANADPRWTNLPLSGLFEQMLRRFLPLVGRASQPSGAPQGSFALETALDAEGMLVNPRQPRQVSPQDWEAATASPQTPPGLYRAGGVSRVLNLMRGNGPISPLFRFEPLADAAGLPVSTGTGARAPVDLATPLLILGLLLAVIDGFLSLGKALPFRWPGKRTTATAAIAALALLAGVLAIPQTGHAQILPPLVPRQAPADEIPAAAVDPVQLGYVTTGNPAADSLARTGLDVLTRVLGTRTAVRAGAPVAVNLEKDELGPLALIYWPVTGGGAGARPLSPEAAARLSAYLSSGGLLVVDLGANPPPPGIVRQVLQPLGLPRLEPLTSDHVLARSFYLLDRYPGRVQGQTVWVEAGTEGGSDGAVAAVVMGSADWAGAWASHQDINARQREWALRFGVNLVMYALTGTYKADQVHVKAILDRLPERHR
ncbi:DUF4159 domain-containing protein [Pedomonas mirosovicensis]|uniref:DUF4159 domain-containing protein n=1 Tax=Pedomonas mirosovicensis TaxID=2908641 RepID=UPI0021677624|nr:DUF4159 domain-containing protein [Pedomonas mirosovicensis]MCH8684296.1 DUF4159 domain-containing protein [Pedomonas mirosovicensis]